jgi:hypothetical protein
MRKTVTGGTNRWEMKPRYVIAFVIEATTTTNN